MLSKNQITHIVSLQKKKYRDEYGLYAIEGDKMVKEYLSAGMPVSAVYAKKEWIATQSRGMLGCADEVVTVSYDEIKKISSLKTPHNAIAIVRINKNIPEYDEITTGYCIALETIQDPGNLGTIIRSADWFGIPYIICSHDTVDCYNPKVVQASMGGMIRVKVLCLDLESFLQQAVKKGTDVFGTYPSGISIYNLQPGEKGIILFGNESKGISASLNGYVTTRLTIPRGNNTTGGIDSLNVAMSASVVLSEFTRRLREQHGK